MKTSNKERLNKVSKSTIDNDYTGPLLVVRRQDGRLVTIKGEPMAEALQRRPNARIIEFDGHDPARKEQED
jgi:hypothetical protein